MNWKEFISQIKSFFKSMNKKQRVVFFGALAGLLIALIIIISIGSHVQYAPLFTDLNAQSAGEVISYLEQHKIPYKVIAGNIIEVPRDEVYRLRLKLAAANIPNSGVVGFEIFNHQGFGVTNFVENVNYLRALEGELTRTIESIKEVKYARVNLAIPKPTIFTSEQKPPKASVLLDLYAPISHQKVVAIQKLVAASVSGLTYKNVTVVDSQGHLLSATVSSSSRLASNELKYKALVESEYKNKIKQMLLPILGNSRFVVGIDVDLDLSKTETKSVTYNPNSVVVSEEKESSKSTSPVSGGTPGVISNVAKGSQSKLPMSTSEKSKSITNFDVGKTETQTVEPYIKVKRVSVAVIVDGVYKPVKNKKGKITGYKYEPLPKSELNTIKEAVMNAIGYDPSRKDSVSVVSMPFRQQVPSSQGMVQGFSVKSLLMNPLIFKYLIIAILVLLFYVFFLRKFLRSIVEQKEKAIEAGKTVGEGEVIKAEEAKGKSVRELEEEIAAELESQPEMTEEQIKHKLIEDKVREIADENPEEVALLLKSMLSSKQK